MLFSPLPLAAEGNKKGRTMHRFASASRAIALLASLLLAACADGGGDPASTRARAEPALETEPAKLDAALNCTPFEHPDKPPVLLVHGTFTTGEGQYNWTYKPLLAARGYDVCIVTYPDWGLGDSQVSAEYIVHALRRIHAGSGRPVAMIGHSQGVIVPRWALKWWPSTRTMVDDFVMQAGPNHGSNPLYFFYDVLAGLGVEQGPVKPVMPESLQQMAVGSAFIAALNRDDETPGDVSYTSLYTQYDELVQPVAPVPTAALDSGRDNPRVANILLQDVCAHRLVDHASIGLVDRLAFLLALDAIGHPGPASIERTIADAGGIEALCGAVPLIPDLELVPLPEMLGGMFSTPPPTLPPLHLSSEEPPLKPYAR